MIFTPMEMLSIMAYVVLANSWAIFAITMNSLFHHENPTILKVVECYLYNVVFFPLALWLAIYNTTMGNFDRHIKHPGTDKKIADLASKLNEAGIENALIKSELASVYKEMSDAAKSL